MYGHNFVCADRMRNYLMYENKRGNNKLNTQNFLPPIVTGMQHISISEALKSCSYKVPAATTSTVTYSEFGMSLFMKK